MEGYMYSFMYSFFCSSHVLFDVFFWCILSVLGGLPSYEKSSSKAYMGGPKEYMKEYIKAPKECMKEGMYSLMYSFMYSLAKAYIKEYMYTFISRRQNRLSMWSQKNTYKMASDMVLQSVFIIFRVSAQSRGSHANSARSCLNPLVCRIQEGKQRICGGPSRFYSKPEQDSFPHSFLMLPG